MIRSLHIEGYRSLQDLRMKSLDRVNLLVGANNSGKTSVTEAILLLAQAGDPIAIYSTTQRRGERIAEDPDFNSSEREGDISHLFYGHEVRVGSSFSISSENDSETSMELRVSAIPAKFEEDLFSTLGADTSEPIALQIEFNFPENPIVVPLSSRGGLSSAAIRRGQRTAKVMPGVYVSTESLRPELLVRMWDAIVLTPDEDFVLEALRYIDPMIERIAPVSARTYSASSRGSFLVKRSTERSPVPLGSMGDGMWRMMAMAIAITQSRGGLLVIDEIDTGLHYTVMDEMWRMLRKAAKDFDVQLFATTHSYDCVYSLARSLDYGSEATVHRIERGRSESVPYSLEEMRVAANQGIEVR